MSKMTKTLEAWKEYRRIHGQKAIDKFFEAHPEVAYWKETFEWMLESNTDFYCDDKWSDGTGKDWSYALHFDDDNDYTYICVVERE